jgi:hypothetical protein
MPHLASPIIFGSMPPKTNDLPERLHALARALNAAGLKAAVDKDHESAELFVRVINPDRPTYRDRITVLHHEGDNHTQWFFHSWLAPIAAANDIELTAIAIRETLTPRPGTPDDQS